MQPSSLREKRSYPRKVFYNEVFATNDLGQVSRLLCVDVSNSGIGLISFTPIKIGEVFELEFSLTDNNDLSKHKISAEVVQSHNTSEIYALGLRFKEELDLHRETQAS